MNQVFLRRLIGSLAGICLSAGTAAVAADLPSRAPAPLPLPPAFTWTGAYFGVQVGGGSGPTTINTDNAFPLGPFGQNFSFQSGGVFGGIHLGYNIQMGPLVIGLQGEYNFAGITGNASGAFTNVTNSIRQFGSVDGRVGMAFDRLLVYAIGGFAYADIRNSVGAIFVNRDYIASQPGWDVGGGLEYALADNWTVRAEYRYYNWGKKTFYDTINNFVVVPGFFPPHSTQDTLHTGRIGLTYKFGAPAAPIVAKY